MQWCWIHDPSVDTRLFDSKWVKIETGRGVTTLTLPNLYKDDEGLYTLRMVTRGGTAEHSAFVSVAGELDHHKAFLHINNTVIKTLSSPLLPVQMGLPQSPVHLGLLWTSRFTMPIETMSLCHGSLLIPLQRVPSWDTLWTSRNYLYKHRKQTNWPTTRQTFFSS